MDIVRKLNQSATYWAQTAQDVYGKGTFSSPTAKACRWEDSSELFIDKMGQEVTCKSKIFFAEDLALEGYLFLGSSAVSSPLDVPRAYEIRQIKRIPDIRNARTLYVVFL